MSCYLGNGKFAFVVALLFLVGCGEKASPTPTIESLELLLSVSFPGDCRVIGSTGSIDSNLLCLVVSSEPLPQPSEASTNSSRRKGSKGTPFPASALNNLMASCGVAVDDVPQLKAETGISRIGQVGNLQVTYRAAETEQGWLTAIELYPQR